MLEPSSEINKIDLSRIAQDLQIRKLQVESVVQLLDEGNTIPFITRYRKERTGGLDEEILRTIQARVSQARQLADRKQTILKSIDAQGKLTDALKNDVLAAETPKRLEDLYLPYKPKKRTLATDARERGLEPLALAVWNKEPAVLNLKEVLPTLVDPEKQLATPEDVQAGLGHILAELIAETADVRATIRFVLWETGRLTTTKSDKLKEGEGLDFKDYFQFTEPLKHVPPHRVLAINRGEKAGALTVKLEFDAQEVDFALFTGSPHRPPALPLGDHPHGEFLKGVANDSLARLILPSLEREIRKELTAKAEEHAVDVFARNLSSLLLAPPLRGKRVLAIDPGFRTGCKLAALDETGNLLEDAVIFPHPPQKKKSLAKVKLEELVRKHQSTVIAIGNGTACRESEELVSDLLTEFDNRRKGIVTPALPTPTQPGPSETMAPAQTASAELHAPTQPSSSVAEPTPAPTPSPAPEPGQPVTEAIVPSPEVASAPTAAEAASVTTAEAPSAAATPETPASPPPAKEEPTPAVDPSLPEPSADLAYVIVNEAGASVYSASPVGREEFPNFDATLRGTISIGRRLQDPLSELVKVDPQNIGVGLYQHDVHPKYLKESLEVVIESCVNHVGVDLNTASVPLLRHVSGLNQLAARELVDYRKQNGPFRSREQLQQVPGIGPARYVQAAGFLKLDDGDEPLDRTWIHPESYPIARQLLSDLGYGPGDLSDKQKTDELREKLKGISPAEVSARLQVGEPTLRDILDALARPGRDPREDLPAPIFKKGILKLEDLQPGMELKGTVLNVVDFGAFIDVGLKDSGLVHISQMANRYIKSPYDVVAVGDVVTAWVMTVDHARNRVSLTMIKPGTERKPQERRPPAPHGERREQGERPEQRDGRPRRGGPRRPPQGPGQGPPGQGQQGQRGRGPRRHGGPPPREGAPPQPAGAPGTPGESPPPGEQGRRPPAGPPPRPRRPQHQVPKPKLTQEALQGKAPLRTFRELDAFFFAKKEEPPKKEEPALVVPPPTEPKVEEAPAPPAT